MASFFGRLKSNAVSRRVLPSYAIGEQQTAATNSSGDLSSLNASEGFVRWFGLPIANLCALQGATSPSIGGSPTKKDANAPQPTPLEKMLVDAGPLRNDGSDKFFGMENVSLLSTYRARNTNTASSSLGILGRSTFLNRLSCAHQSTQLL